MNRRLLDIALDIFDEGLQLYRREFVSFVVLAAAWLVPIALGVGLSIAASQFMDSDITTLLMFGWFVVGLPASIYLIVGLSRVTLAVQQQRKLDLRETLGISPIRVAGMGCYSIIFTVTMAMAVSTISFLLICPLYMVMALWFGSAAALGASSGWGGFTILSMSFFVIFALIYVLMLALSGVTYSSLVYVLQPFIHQRKATFGRALQQSLNLIDYRMKQNLLTFFLASALFGSTSLAVTVAIGVIIPMPLLLALGEHSPVAQGVSVSAWLIGLIFVLPPMPIWMTLLYQHNQSAYVGEDLVEPIARVVHHESPQQ
jgi:hypothetical protein